MYRETTLPTTRSWFDQNYWNIWLYPPLLQVCHFEIFKIRGVASKQLVQDAVFSRPAHFVSFQQVRVESTSVDDLENKILEQVTSKQDVRR